LQKYNLPYEITGGTKFFDRREVKDILAYLRAIDNLKDSISLERIINTPRRGIGAGTINRITEDGQIPIWDAIAAEGAAQPNSKTGSFFKLMLGFLEAADNLKVSTLCKKIIDDISYVDYLKKDDPETAQDREYNVQALVSDIRYMEEDNQNLTLSEYLANAALHSAQDDIEENNEKVHLMTLHNAKGLEFPVIIMMAMEEGIFPHHSSKDAPEELEEERRLAYVGMTRAKRRLLLTASSRRMMFGSWGSNPVSRFVTEVPNHLYGYESNVSRSKTSSWSSSGSERKMASSIPGAVSSKVVAGSNAAFPRANWSEKRKVASQMNDSTGTEAATMINLEPGVKVRHGIFGDGIIVATEGSSLADFRVTVSFDKKGRKTLLLQYANLRVIK
jgi:DNA helicase-2/ATP-dependent DNA helicase PcrA